MLSGLQPQPRAALDRSGILERIGDAAVLPSIDQALERARDLLARSGVASLS